MPANKKHLAKSKRTRISKILAAFVGAYIASAAVHIMLAYFIGFEKLIATSIFSLFLLWVVFMLLVFCIKAPWKVWALLVSTIVLSAIIIYIKKQG